MKRILINARQGISGGLPLGEIRIAVVHGRRLYSLDAEYVGASQTKGSIFTAYVTRIEESLEAAFVEFGKARQSGFLPLKEISPDQFQVAVPAGEKPDIKKVLKEGQKLLVQVRKEERMNKRAALSTYIGLPGCYLVLKPNDPGAGGISRRLEGEERAELQNRMAELNLPNNMGLIIRTAGEGRNLEELQWDLNVLRKQWDAIQEAYEQEEAPSLIHRESDVIVRSIRDYLRKDVNEIVIDCEEAYQKTLEHVRYVHPNYIDRVKLYQEPMPLFTHFHIESQIEAAFQREIRLPTGGSIVIDYTEALISIDVNSSRATKGSNIEETAFETNLAAAQAIADQLRIRDDGGIVVIDFIDMEESNHQREVIQKLRDALRDDRARIRMTRSPSFEFGVIILSRQRLRPAIADTAHQPCSKCNGRGRIRSPESFAATVARQIEKQAIKPQVVQIHAQVPQEIGIFMLNEKRALIENIEQRCQVKILIIPNPHIDASSIRYFKQDDLAKAGDLITKPEPKSMIPAVQHETALVDHIKPDVPNPGQSKKKGILQRISNLFNESKQEATDPPKASTNYARHSRNGNSSTASTSNRRKPHRRRHARHTQRHTNKPQQTRTDKNSSEQL